MPELASTPQNPRANIETPARRGCCTKPRVWPGAVVLAAFALLTAGATAELPAQSAPQLLELTVIFSEKGRNWTSDRSPALDSLQREHQAFRLRLVTEGKLFVAGPFDTKEGDEVRGMAIACRLSGEEVSSLLAADPKIKAGHLQIRVVTWFVPATAAAFVQCGLPPSEP